MDSDNCPILFKSAEKVEKFVQDVVTALANDIDRSQLASLIRDL